MLKVFKSTDIGEIPPGENVSGKEQMFRTKHWAHKTFGDQAAEQSQGLGTDTGQSKQMRVATKTGAWRPCCAR